MNEQKKYYWLKLKRDFFKRHDTRIIEDMENGEKYLLFYLKLLVESIDHEGSLRFSDTIPYNEKMLSTITNTDIDIVRTAVKVFSELGMMEQLDDGTLYMNQVKSMVGAETEWAEKKRIYRQTKQIEGNTDDGQKKTKSDKSKRLELEKEKEKDICKPEKKESRKEYGEFKNVLLTLEDYQELSKRITGLDLLINKMSLWLTQNGKKPYKNYKAALLNWYSKEEKSTEPERIEKKYTCDYCGMVYTDFCRNPECPGLKL